MNERGARWLRKQVRVFAGYDHQKQHSPMAEGEVIGYIDGPSIVVRTADGKQEAWPVSLPIEELAHVHRWQDVSTYSDGDVRREVCTIAGCGEERTVAL